MPPEGEPSQPERPIEEIVGEIGDYPLEAYEFVQRGLQYTVQKRHGEEQKAKKEGKQGRKSRHVSGQELCEGLREFALIQWGMLARTVLGRWNLTKTEDFGRIVFALVDNGYMSKTDQDTIEDFKNVFDFRAAFENDYRIESRK